MSEQAQLIIRDGKKADIEKCLQLDSGYHTEYVWQITIRDEADETRIALRQQRLPRALDSHHPLDANRLSHSLDQENCFIVMEESTSNMILGFVSMRIDAAYQFAYLQDIVIDEPYRHQGLGTRLVNVARLWADEQNLKRIIFEVPTVNFPAIEFAKSQGFTYCGFNDQYLPNQDIALFYCLTL